MKDDYINNLTELAQKYDYLWIITVVHTDGSSPRKTGSKMIVGSKGKLLWGSIGGGVIERKATLATLDMKEPKLVSYDISELDKEKVIELEHTGMICGGSMTIYYEPHGNLFKPQVWIFGAGHCGKALYELMVKLNWTIIVCDNRPEVLNEQDFPNAERRYGPYEELVNKAKEEFNDEDYIVIMTYGHKWDYEVIRVAIHEKWRYLGMMGSEKKIAFVMERLRKEKVQEDLLSKVNSPIGLNNIGETPEEIAVDIMAKIMSVQYAN